MTGIEIALSQVMKTVARGSLETVLVNKSNFSKRKKSASKRIISKRDFTDSELQSELIQEALDESEKKLFLLKLDEKKRKIQQERLNAALLNASKSRSSYQTLCVANRKKKQKKKKK